LRDFNIYADSLIDQTKKLDLYFDFQAFMKNEIVKLQSNFAEENKFSMINDPMEFGYIASLTEQLKIKLFDIRNICKGLQKNFENAPMKRCPHCNLIWQKLEGCDGTTTCGNKTSNIESRNIYSNFEFNIFDNEKTSY